MDHLAYIIPAYALTLLGTAGYAWSAWARMRRASRRLAAIDPRAANGQRAGAGQRRPG
jgi:hypothetical protein